MCEFSENIRIAVLCCAFRRGKIKKIEKTLDFMMTLCYSILVCEWVVLCGAVNAGMNA